MQESSHPSLTRLPWLWVLGGFLFQTIPAALRDEALPVVLKNHGVNDGTITQVVGVLGLIVALKIFWAPFLSLLGKPRTLIISCQAGMIVCILLLNHFIGLEQAVIIAIVLCILTLLSGGHDYLLDGYYVHSLDDNQRAKYSGLLNFASKLGQVLAGPGLIYLAWFFHTRSNSPTSDINLALICLAVFSLVVLLITQWGFKREPDEAVSENQDKLSMLKQMGGALKLLYRDSRFPIILGLIFFYRASEVHMNHVIKLFAKASVLQGGLGLDDETYAYLRITTAILGLAIGGIIGSAIITRRGLTQSLVPLGICMHLPLIGISWLSFNVNPLPSLTVISVIFFIEYLAFGAGLCALILAMMKLAAGAEAAVRYALLSTLSLVAVYLPGLWAGKLSNFLGYSGYFLAALALAIPGVIVAILAARKLEES
jgi:MFS transporter, PAT family, beta-lactamase induction signal transducer AmpG